MTSAHDALIVFSALAKGDMDTGALTTDTMREVVGKLHIPLCQYHRGSGGSQDVRGARVDDLEVVGEI